MRAERFVLDEDDPAGAAARIRALVAAPDAVSRTVAEILADVRARGEVAVREYTARLDTPDGHAPPLEATDAELDDALERLDPGVREGLEVAIANVEAVAAAARQPDRREVAFPGHTVTLRREPLGRVGVYVPGGRAPYPSTVVMGVVPARVAGVEEVVVCAPPSRATGTVDAVILAACRLAGASTVLRIGGAQAIAALAYGLRSLAPVDLIVGPGNVWVQEAKRQVAGTVAIDGFAGPSDLLVLAGADAEVEPIVLDLLAQAEHGPGTLVVALLADRAQADAVAAGLGAGAETGAAAHVGTYGHLDAALSFAQAFAPEHLELVGTDAEKLAPEITRAGCVFVGGPSATAFGDYVAGSNHVLPTDGAARFASALSLEHFVRRFTEVRVDDASRLARAATPLARAEGFEWHARSMEARIRDNGGDDAHGSDRPPDR